MNTLPSLLMPVNYAPTIPMPELPPLTPFQIGCVDAQKGEFCLPELYFGARCDREQYAQGYEYVAGATLLSSQVLAKPRNNRALTSEEIDAELQDLVDGREDDEYNARHCSFGL